VPEDGRSGTEPRAPGPARQLRSILALPGVVTLVVPALILGSTGGWPGLSSPAAWPRLALVLAGGGLIGSGLALTVAAIRSFARSGSGTLAPWDPTSRLVVEGVYRHVRNPMITGVMLILLGEAAVFASLHLLVWFGVFAVVNAFYIPLVEEPGLARRFGAAYTRYRRNVPRWIPRTRPWTPRAGG
jgi:protein-S-isoprenylcysteine O-methyltransferase Ste14